MYFSPSEAASYLTMLDLTIESPLSLTSPALIAAFKCVVFVTFLRHVAVLQVRLFRYTSNHNDSLLYDEGRESPWCTTEKAQRTSSNSFDAPVIIDQTDNTFASPARIASPARAHAASETLLSASSDSTVPGNTDVPVGFSNLSSSTSTDILRAAHKVSVLFLFLKSSPQTSFASPAWPLLDRMPSPISRPFTLDLTPVLNCAVQAPTTRTLYPLQSANSYRMLSPITRHTISGYSRTCNSFPARPRLTATITRYCNYLSLPKVSSGSYPLYKNS